MSRSFDDLLPTALDDISLAELSPLTRVSDLLILLERWVERGWLRALDKAFVAFLSDLDPQADPLVLVAAALTSHQLGHGHVCLDLYETLKEPDFALSLPPEGDQQSAPMLLPSQLLAALDGAAWCQALADSMLVAEVGDSSAEARQKPLVLAERRLYLRRYWTYERRIAAALRQRLAQRETPPEGLPQQLDALFGPADPRHKPSSTGRNLPARWRPARASASSPAAPAPAKPPRWYACWPCCKPRRYRMASRCASGSRRPPARRRHV